MTVADLLQELSGLPAHLPVVTSNGEPVLAAALGSHGNGNVLELEVPEAPSLPEYGF